MAVMVATRIAYCNARCIAQLHKQVIDGELNFGEFWRPWERALQQAAARRGHANIRGFKELEDFSITYVSSKSWHG
jgi:hypothetical protein